MADVSDEELTHCAEVISRLREAATGGPWEAHHYLCAPSEVVGRADGRVAFVARVPKEEADYIATLHNTVPTVLAALTELQARRAAEAKAVEVDLPDYLRFGEPDMFPPAQK
jgi:hypothetical protein